MRGVLFALPPCLLFWTLVLVLAVNVTRAHAEGYDATDARQAIATAAETYGVSEAWLLSTAACEAPGLNPYAVGRQGELGLAQLHPRGELRRFYSQGYSDPFDPFEAMDFMARRFAAGGASAWTCS